MNNYFHDLATAMPLACGIVAWMIFRKFERGMDDTVTAYFLRLYKGMTRLAWFSLAWIILGAIPRALTFTTFEWPNAVEKHHEAGLIAKYVIAVVMMLSGGALWFLLMKKTGKATRGII